MTFKIGRREETRDSLLPFATPWMGESVDFGSGGSKIMHRRAHAINRQLVCGGIVHDASLADVFPARFELWLDQDDSLNAAARSPRTAASTAGSTSVAEMNDTSMDTKLIPGGQIAGLEGSGHWCARAELTRGSLRKVSAICP